LEKSRETVHSHPPEAYKRHMTELLDYALADCTIEYCALHS